jgi:hypothetical protein
MKTRQPTAGSQKQPPDPYQVIKDFFERYELHECEAELWQLLSAAFASEDADLWDKHDRGNTVFFCRNLDQVLKALYKAKDQLNRNTQA